MKRELQFIVNDEGAISYARDWVGELASIGLKGGPVRVSVGRPRRSLDQNAKLWPMLTDVSKQVDWHGNRLKPEEWKDVFTAALRKQKAVPGIDGGFVILGAHTSTMPKDLFSELIELIYAFGAEHDVTWSEHVQTRNR